MTDGGAAPSADRMLERAARARQEATALRDRLEAATRHADGTTLRVQETREAHAAGLAARDLLLRARQLLGHAQSWSTWDTFGGGGLITDLMKYDRLDEVAQVLRLADLALGAFSRELADLRLAGVGGVQVDGLTRTFDVFFDNIFTDLHVRSRIQEAGRRVEHALQAVTHTLGELSERGRRCAGELAALDRSREDLLT